MDCAEKFHCSDLGFREYVEALEVERKKIQVFQRELPLCLELVTQTIERCKQQISSGATTTTEYLHGHQSEECNSDQTSSEAHHVFEEFIPLKRSCSQEDNNNNNNNNNNVNDEDEDDVDDEEQESAAGKSSDDGDNDDSKNKKQDWLRSVQLWNDPNPDPPQKHDLANKSTEVKRNGGGFQPFQREKNAAENSSGESPPEEPVNTPAASSTAGDGKREDSKDGLRKQRRNWSPELHKRFLNALQQLGGSHAATPKQIRELMKVDGLTNDEVKSHLQKYRLHTRRPTQGIIHPNNGNAQTPQVVFVGGIWVQPSEYVAATTGNNLSASGIYAPVAAPPPMIQSSPHHKKQLSHSSNSPATSSSTHNTTTSHGF